MYRQIGKRIIDFLLSFWAISVLWPVGVIIAVWIYLDDKESPIFYSQKRIGRNFRPFYVHKFRSMRSATKGDLQVTIGADKRITQPGKFIRATKLDELPQLLNILLGEMSIIGPRPEVPKYVEMYKADYKEVLSIRPGLSDFASLKYYNEAEILGQQANPEQYYAEVILPDKIALAKKYIAEMSLLCDVNIIFKTIFKSL